MTKIISLLWGACFLFAIPSYGVSFLEQSKRLQLINTHLLDFRYSVPSSLSFEPKHEVLLLSDWTVMPSVDNQVGLKKENIDTPPILPRARVRYTHPLGVFVGGSWSPPVRIMNYQANLFNIEVGWNYIKKSWLFSGRLVGSSGEVEGPVTEKDEDDTFIFSRQAIDGIVGYLWKKWRFYIGSGHGILHTQLNIKSDGARLKTDGYDYYYLFGGATFLWEENWVFGVEQNRTEHFVKNIVLSAGYLF